MRTRPIRLMIVDDHAGVRELIRVLVAIPADLVHECNSAEEAVRVATEFRPDCVTMDVNMPGLSAFVATRAIQAGHADARVIMVTSFDKGDLRRAAFAAGASGYVVKDNLAALPEVIQRCLVQRH